MSRLKIVADKQAPMSPMIRLMCGDARTQIVRIVIPRLFGDVDLCDLTWSIKVVNSKGVADVCTPYGDVQCTDEEIIVDWLICGVATAAPGITNFEIIGVDETVDGHPIVWQSGIGNLLVSECLNASSSGDQGEQLSSLDKLIIYVNGELPNVIAAGEAASNAAKLANDAAERAEKAAEGKRVTSVNGVGPDENGNVQVSGLPEGGNTGDVLIRTEDGAEWQQMDRLGATDADELISMLK